MCPAMMFPATRSNPVDRVAFNGLERPRDRADSRGRQRAIERAAAQLLGPGQFLAHLRAWTSPAPAGCPGAKRSLTNRSGRYMSHTMAMTQARCHLPAQTLMA